MMMLINWSTTLTKYESLIVLVVYRTWYIPRTTAPLNYCTWYLVPYYVVRTVPDSMIDSLTLVLQESLKIIAMQTAVVEQFAYRKIPIMNKDRLVK
jgi:urea transporter